MSDVSSAEKARTFPPSTVKEAAEGLQRLLSYGSESYQEVSKRINRTMRLGSVKYARPKP